MPDPTRTPPPGLLDPIAQHDTHHEGHAIIGLDRALLVFAQDAGGEVYALVNFPGVPFGNTGEVLQLVPAARWRRLR